jgi:putative flavoprotein involved in K+ transport
VVVVIDCVVVGGGPAGLAASGALTRAGVDHLVLERDRVGQTWRDQRWDSFRLNTPGWMNQLLGEQPRDAYLTAPELVERLAALAARAPVREGTGVTRLRRAGDRFVLHTGDGELRARTVVVASGGENVPSLPPAARDLPDRIAQCHVADYRSPAALPAGAVLVVGSAQSGCQVADDLLSAGRRVILATSQVGRLPTPYRGRDTVEWLAEVGFFDQRPEDLPDPSAVHQRQPIVASGGRALGLPQLARSGATLVGQLVEVSGERARFKQTVAANVAAGEAFATRVHQLVDGIIARRGITAPPAEPEELGPQPDSPELLDLRADEVSTVVWCTGFTGDFSWLDPDLRQDPAVPVPGLWNLGRRWLPRRASSILYGMPGDAAEVAAAVRSHLA